MEYVLNVSYKGFLTIAESWFSFERLFKESNILGYNLWRLFDYLRCHGRYPSQCGWMTSDRHVGKWVLQRYYIAKKLLDEKKRHRCDFLFAKGIRKTKEMLINHLKHFCGKVLWVLRNIWCFCSVRIVGGGTQNAHAISRNTPGLGSVNKWRKTKTKNNNNMVKY